MGNTKTIRPLALKGHGSIAREARCRHTIRRLKIDVNSSVNAGLLIENGLLYRDRVLFLPLLPGVSCHPLPTPSPFTPATQAIFDSVETLETF